MAKEDLPPRGWGRGELIQFKVEAGCSQEFSERESDGAGQAEELLYLHESAGAILGACALKTFPCSKPPSSASVPGGKWG